MRNYEPPQMAYLKAAKERRFPDRALR